LTTMWQSLLNSDAGKGLVESLEKAGDAITKGAQRATAVPTKTSSRTEIHTDSSDPGLQVFLDAAGIVNDASAPRQDLLMTSKIKSGWGSLVETTKQTLKKTQEAVEKEQVRLVSRFQNRPYRRDPSLPLDVDALRDAEVVYITDRLLTMSHPAMQSSVDGDITPIRKLAAVGQLLHKRHDGKFMVWNMSEVDYDISVLDDQVLTFSFPGSPSPPLGLWLKLLISMESWLKADPQNVAVLHCLTGKGRTSTVLAAFLCWIGEANFSNITTALEYIAKCKHVPLDELIIPSQRRYSSYFANMLDGVRPSQPPLLLKRILMTCAPSFAKGPPRDDIMGDDDEATTKLLSGCAPYLQIFKAGQLVFTTAATLHANQSKDELPFCAVADGPICFHVETVVQGDILIRCRHLTFTGQRVSMFRAAFHTGYVPPNVLRLSRAQLDGACSDKRFPDEFHVDLIFEACDAEMAAKHLSGKADAQEEENDTPDSSQNEAKERRQKGIAIETSPVPNTTQQQGPIVTASAYDSMLHRDSRFWDVIAARRQAHATWTQEGDPLWGPTIGRRRDFSQKLSTQGVSSSTHDTNEAKTGDTKLNSLESFSIGGDSFNFDSFVVTPIKAAAVVGLNEEEEPKERDELMEALMALEDDSGSPVKEKGAQEKVAADSETGEDTTIDKDSLFKIEGALESNTQTTEASTSVVNEAAGLLDDDTNDLDLDSDVDAFLSGGEQHEEGTGEGDDALALDDFDFDDDDDDIEDLEKFLSK